MDACLIQSIVPPAFLNLPILLSSGAKAITTVVLEFFSPISALMRLMILRSFSCNVALIWLLSVNTSINRLDSLSNRYTLSFGRALVLSYSLS